MSPRRATVWLAAALLWVLGGCGVPAEPTPRDIPVDQVPFGLSGATTTTTSRPVPSATATVFLVKGDRLLPVRRQLPAPVTPAAVLAALAGGPSPSDSAHGLRSALVTGVMLERLAGGTATVRLDRELVAGDVREQILALAQLVYTMTELPGVQAVQFTFDGRPAEVPTAEGNLKAGTASRADYLLVGPAG